jgi:hypothetical protein
MPLRFLRWIIFIFPFVSAIFAGSGCIKEYSFEQGSQDTASVVDTLLLPSTSIVSTCTACNTTEIPDSSWRVTIGNRVYCGKAEKAIISPDRTGFTFFGASFCSADSGLVTTVYLDNMRLDVDRTNVGAKMGAYYYDRIGATHIYESISAQPLRLVIHSYTHQTGIATGVFSGTFLDHNGTAHEVKNGRFRIRLSR